MTVLSFSIFSFIFSSNQVCIFVVWKQSIESGTYQLSVSRPGPREAGHWCTARMEATQTPLLLPGSALKSSRAIDVDKPKLQGQLCPGKPESLSYFVLLRSFYIKLGKEKWSNNNKMDKYTGQLLGVSSTYPTRHSCSCPRYSLPNRWGLQEVNTQFTSGSAHGLPHSRLLITEAKISSNWVGIQHQSQSQPRGKPEARSHSSQHKHKFVCAK